MFYLLRAGAFSLAIVASACGGAGAPSPAAGTPTPKPNEAVGFASVKLSDGPLDALPTLPLYVSVLDVPQQPAAPIQHAHIAGFVYVVTGTHKLSIQGGETKEIKAGEAAFVANNAIHTHENPGTTASQWYFLALRNTSARTAAATFPGQSVLYETADLPATAMPAGKYMEQLNITTVEKGGRTASHKHGGLEIFVITEGTGMLKVAGQQPQTLTKGKGAVVMPNTALQLTNTGDGPVKWLAYLITKEGETFSTNLDTLP
jgi:quercetin dioxygenase-like cupin family protein